MIARRRGEHDVRQVWWPRRPWGALPSAGQPPGGGDGGDGGPWSASGAGREPPRHSRRAERHPLGAWLLGSLAAVGLIGLGFAGGELVRQARGGPRPPLAGASRAPLVATPRAWLHDFSVYSLSRPVLICSRLFSPAFAAVYEQDTGTSCGHYLGHSRVTPLKLRHIVQDGSTAVIELGTDSRTDWTIVLARQAGGWRQIDFIAGTPAR